MKHMTIVTGLVFMVAGMAAAGDKNPPTNAQNGFAWKSDIPADCPFERSKTLTGIFFTGRHRDYGLADTWDPSLAKNDDLGDTWYPSWASDGNLYSPFTDGEVGGVGSGSGQGANAETGVGKQSG